jgi:hypothetical protein
MGTSEFTIIYWQNESKSLRSRSYHCSTTQYLSSSSTNNSCPTRPLDAEVEVVGSICPFCQATFNTFLLEGIITMPGYRTEIVPTLWNLIK